MTLGTLNFEPKYVRRRACLTPDLQARALAVHATFKQHMRKDTGEWADGFCFDMHPDKEIAVWERYAEIYQKFVKGKPPYYRAVAWRAILEDIAITPVIDLGLPNATPAPVTCPFAGSATKVFAQIVEQLRNKSVSE